jgi:DNA polymerase III subunit beta
MKFSCSAEALQRGVSAVQNAVGTKISNPIVENIKIEVSQDNITFYGTNLSLFVRCQCDCQVEEPGEIALPTDYLQSIIKELPSCEIMVMEEDGCIVLKTPSGRLNLKEIPSDDFPVFNGDVGGEPFEISIATFKSICRRTLFATSPEKARFELDGVKVIIEDGKMICVATDGRRLSHTKEDIEDKNIKANALIPSRTMTELNRILPSEGNIKVCIGSSKIYFECGDIALVSSLLEDKFPPFEQIIPKNFEVSINVEREPLFKGLRVVSTLSNERTNLVKMSLEENKIVLLGERDQIGSAREEVPVEYSGDTISVGYKASYLQDALRASDEDKIEINLINSMSPGVFRSGKSSNFTHVIMPMQFDE